MDLSVGTPSARLMAKMTPDEFDRSWIKRLLLLLYWSVCCCAGLLAVFTIYILMVKDLGRSDVEESAVIIVSAILTPALLWGAYFGAKWVAWGRREGAKRLRFAAIWWPQTPLWRATVGLLKAMFALLLAGLLIACYLVLTEGKRVPAIVSLASMWCAVYALYFFHRPKPYLTVRDGTLARGQASSCNPDKEPSV